MNAEGNIQRPVQFIFHSLMAAHLATKVWETLGKRLAKFSYKQLHARATRVFCEFCVFFSRTCITQRPFVQAVADKKSRKTPLFPFGSNFPKFCGPTLTILVGQVELRLHMG
jgi:hypothetical protein